MNGTENELYRKIEEIIAEKPSKLIISNPKKKEQEFRKIEMEEKEQYVQGAKYTKTQVFHENIPKNEWGCYLTGQLEDFTQLNAWSDQWEYELKISKKGKVFCNRKKTDYKVEVTKEHNRKKKYILEEGVPIPPLVDMGVFTKTGEVVKSMYDKYRQINRFVEIVDDMIRTKGLRSLTVIDFGCGKSYLTFIMYYYLTEIMKIEVKMVGLDLKEDVIKNCNEAAKKYGYKNLKFELGDINGYQCDSHVDMVITLHACDTATDYALYNAIRWNAEMIISVPCCQHELNAQVKSKDYSILTKYGIIKERFAALATDAIRGSLLEYSGYSTQLLEFIDFSHTPKNILIRAVKNAKLSEVKKNAAMEETERVMKEFHLQPTFYHLLKDRV